MPRRKAAATSATAGDPASQDASANPPTGRNLRPRKRAAEAPSTSAVTDNKDAAQSKPKKTRKTKANQDAHQDGAEDQAAQSKPEKGDAEMKDDPDSEPEPAAVDDAPEPKTKRGAKASKTSKAKQDSQKDDANGQASQPKTRKRGAKVKDDPDAQPATTANAPKAEPAEAEAEADEPPESAQVTSEDIKIPVDEAYGDPGVSVYIDPDGVIYDANLNQTNAGKNNNKFYKIQLLRHSASKFKTWTRWGRVGEAGQGTALGDGTLKMALDQFDKKFKSKSGLHWEMRMSAPKKGKYTFVEKSYEPDSDDPEELEDDDAIETASVKEEEGVKKEKEPVPESKLSVPIQKLMELIFNQAYFAATMSDLNYDANKLPLGKLSKSTITRGFQALKDLSDLIDDESLASSRYQVTYARAVEDLSNMYFSLIPHAFGRNKPPVVHNNEMLKKEVELLESLSDMKDAFNLTKKDSKAKDTERINKLDQNFQSLGMKEMTPLDHKGSEFLQLQNYLNSTRGATHGHTYTIDQIFRIERNGEKDRFDKSSFGGSPRNRRLLWHGSRCTNFGGILSQGLRIAPPEAPVSGYAFGKGIYLADMSSKSANYCCSYVSGGQALLMLCEAELGDPMWELEHGSYEAGEDAKAKGMIATWGKGRTGPRVWKDAGCVHPSLSGVKMPDTTSPPSDDDMSLYLQYNEFIAYDVAQVRLRYLFRLQMSVGY